MHRFGQIGLAIAFGAAVAVSGAAHATVATDAQASNTLVSTSVAPTASAQTGGIIASQVGGALGGSTPVGNNNNVSLLDTRSLKGKNAAGERPPMGAWVQGAGTYVDNSETGGKFDGWVYNVLAGIDARVRDNTVVGVALGYENIDIDTEFNSGTFEGEGYTVAPYLGYQINKNWAADLTLGYSYVDYDTSRTSPNSVTGSFDANRFFGAANLAGTYYRDKLRISPKVGLLGLYEKQDSYTDSTGTAVGETKIHLGRALGGVELGYALKGGVEPFALARAEYDFNQNGPVTLTTGQASSDDELGGTFGLGVNLHRDNVTAQLKGETTQFKNEIETYSGSLRVRVDF